MPIHDVVDGDDFDFGWMRIVVVEMGNDDVDDQDDLEEDNDRHQCDHRHAHHKQNGEQKFKEKKR